MSDAGSQVPETLDTPSIDLWKFFEERGAEQKESLFKLITWIIGFAAVVFGFAIKRASTEISKPTIPAWSSFLGLSDLSCCLRYPHRP